jgi:mannose-6-phosphate isomerase-like protein (cupin superfamily)
MKQKAVNLAEKLTLFSEHWSPKIVATYNGNEVMVAKLSGEYHWHKHEDTDDFFFVISGHLLIETEQGDVELGPGELYVVPKGVMHRPVPENEVHILLMEPKGEPNSGDPATAATKVWI